MNRGPPLVVALVGVSLALAPAVMGGRNGAIATSVSSNWAGYVATVRGAPTRFSSVSGAVVLPRASCRSTTTVGPTAAAFWVGLGGSRRGPGTVEQAGVEADCSATGEAHYFAWYELAPGPWVRLRLAVGVGDTIVARVSVVGSRIVVEVADVSRGTRFVATLAMAAPDASSAEWIVEPPSVCTTIAFCGEQMLTDFGTVTFSAATARSGDRAAAIGGSAWRLTRLVLREGGVPFGGLAPEQHAAAAVPGAIGGGGSFSVTWRRLLPAARAHRGSK